MPTSLVVRMDKLCFNAAKTFVENWQINVNQRHATLNPPVLWLNLILVALVVDFSEIILCI